MCSCEAKKKKKKLAGCPLVFKENLKCAPEPEKSNYKPFRKTAP